ncbi:MAG: hypothetical protein PHR45_04230 [Muribaculaceae bacterium]|nr:hypothetical protein [Muribaculaceae bacterium]
MKKKFYFVASFLLCCSTVFAQPKSAGTPQLFIKSQHSLMAPVWSPDGTKIAVTGDNYSGIWIADANGEKLTQITTDDGAGYKMLWNDDSKSLLARSNQMIGQKKYYEVKTYNVVNGSSKVIIPSTRELKGTPTWKNTTEILVSDAKGTAKIKGNAITHISATSLFDAMVNDPVNVAKRFSALAQFSGKIIINPALSPDKSKIAFQVPGKGMWVCKADGSELKSMGKGSYPAWLPDNETIIVSRIKDNGNIFTASDLYSIDSKTANATLLTGDTDLIPITLSVSPDGKKVAFENAPNGYIYIVDLKY